MADVGGGTGRRPEGGAVRSIRAGPAAPIFLALLLLLVTMALVPGAGAQTTPTADRHVVDVLVGRDVSVVESLHGVDRLVLELPTGAAGSPATVETVLRDGRPVAWSLRDGTLHASPGAGTDDGGGGGDGNASPPANYTVAYRLPAGPVDLVRTLRYDVGSATVRIDLPAGWDAEVQGFDDVDRTEQGSDGTVLDATAGPRPAGTAYGARLTVPVTGPPSPGFVPFLALLLVGLVLAGGVAVWRLRQPEPAEMGFWDHYRELRHRLILTLIPLAVAFFVFFLFRLEPATLDLLGGAEVLVPVPAETGGMAAQTFAFFQETLLPTHVQVIVTNPVDAIVAQITVALFLAVVATSPIAAYHAARFIGPALYPHERAEVLKLVPAVTGLFLVGCLFGLLLIVPFAFAFLYGYGVALGAVTFVTAQDFISFTVLLVVAFGLSFELPVAMVGLSAVGVTSEFWTENWRIAVVAIFVFGAAITPDGSGVTMFMVAVPLIALYGAGIWLVRRREQRRGRGGPGGGGPPASQA